MGFRIENLSGYTLFVDRPHVELPMYRGVWRMLRPVPNMGYNIHAAFLSFFLNKQFVGAARQFQIAPSTLAESCLDITHDTWHKYQLFVEINDEKYELGRLSDYVSHDDLGFANFCFTDDDVNTCLIIHAEQQCDQGDADVDASLNADAYESAEFSYAKALNLAKTDAARNKYRGRLKYVQGLQKLSRDDFDGALDQMTAAVNDCLDPRHYQGKAMVLKRYGSKLLLSGSIDDAMPKFHEAKCLTELALQDVEELVAILNAVSIYKGGLNLLLIGKYEDACNKFAEAKGLTPDTQHQDFYEQQQNQAQKLLDDAKHDYDKFKQRLTDINITCSTEELQNLRSLQQSVDAMSSSTRLYIDASNLELSSQIKVRIDALIEAVELKDELSQISKTFCPEEVRQLKSLKGRVEKNLQGNRTTYHGSIKCLRDDISERAQNLEQALDLKDKFLRNTLTCNHAEIDKLKIFKNEISRCKKGFKDDGVQLISDIDARIKVITKGSTLLKKTKDLLENLRDINKVTDLEREILKLLDFITQITTLDNNERNSFPEGEPKNLLEKIQVKLTVLNYFGYVTSLINLSIELSSIEPCNFSDPDNKKIDGLREAVKKYYDAMQKSIEQVQKANLQEVSKQISFLQEIISFNNRFVESTSIEELESIQADIHKITSNIQKVESQGQLVVEVMKQQESGIKRKINYQKLENSYYSLHEQFNKLKSSYDNLQGKYISIATFKDLETKYVDLQRNSISRENLCEEIFKRAKKTIADIDGTKKEDQREMLILDLVCACKILHEYDKEQKFSSDIESFRKHLERLDGGSYSHFAGMIPDANRAHRDLFFTAAPIPQQNFTTSQSSSELPVNANQTRQIMQSSFRPT